MSDERRIWELEERNRHLEARNKQLEDDYNTALNELTQLLETNETLTAQVQELTTGTPSADIETERQALAAERRAFDGEKTFAEVAEELGIKPKYRTAAWRDADFKSEGDAIDKAAMQAHFAAYLADRPEFVQQKPEKVKLPVDVNVQRGPSKPASDGRIRGTAENLADMEWTSANFPLIAQRIKSGEEIAFEEIE
jgi:hypothetical protein